MRLKPVLSGLFLLFMSGLALQVTADVRVRVMALFPGKAMLDINGASRLLRAGERSPEGVRLISATPHEAVIEQDGERRSYGLDSGAGGSFAEVEKSEVTIWRDKSGAFLTVGSINGQTVDMMIDTGATSVAMSEVEARRLGINYRPDGDRVRVHTASGNAWAYALKLGRVQLGPISRNNVQAVVIEGSSPRRVLLGMTFLRGLELQNQGDRLVLRHRR